MSRSGPARPVQFLRGVGPRRAALLEKIGVRTLGDFLTLFPTRYTDRRTATPLARLRPGEAAVVQGTVVGVRPRRSFRKRGSVLEVTIEQGGRRAVLVWFGQAWRAKEFAVGDVVLAAGNVKEAGRLTVDEFEILEEGKDPLHAAGLVPAYPLTEGLGKRQVRSFVRMALEEALPGVREPLPDKILRRRRLPGIRDAFRAIHAPETPEAADEARRRFAYQELFTLQAGLALRRHSLARGEAGRVIVVDRALDFRIRSLFPFKLTGAQGRAIKAIRRDLAAGPPMNRLLQGDVGAGKTVVAAYALLAAVGKRAQAALLAPTEILAEQHLRTFQSMLGHSKVKVGFLGGGISKREREARRAAVAAGEIDLLVGTHAILEEEVRFRDLALIVVDEQQKFGVLQRAGLIRKGRRPHALVMTATPIPRTLALAVYGDLDLSVLDERPPDRKDVATWHVPEAGRKGKMEFVRAKLREGRQAYFVFPLVDESDRVALKSAIRAHRELTAEFPEFRVELLHGRMEPEEKEAAMEAFRSGRARVLVSTIVVEVGIDVPNAAMMVIDHCERYGLSQLHQLRGRIGRGPHVSSCILFGARSERIDVFVSTNDGFKIAEADLRLRGQGDVEGTRQSGLPLFRAARLPQDGAILERAREDAFAWVAKDPDLEGAPELKEALERRSAGGTLLDVG